MVYTGIWRASLAGTTATPWEGKVGQHSAQVVVDCLAIRNNEAYLLDIHGIGLGQDWIPIGYPWHWHPCVDWDSWNPGIICFTRSTVSAWFGQVASMRPRMVMNALNSRNQLATSWWPLVEDIFSSLAAYEVRTHLLAQAVQSGQCRYLQWMAPSVCAYLCWVKPSSMIPHLFVLVHRTLHAAFGHVFQRPCSLEPHGVENILAVWLVLAPPLKNM